MTCGRSSNKSKFNGTATNQTFQIAENIGCKDKNVIYIVECTKCPCKPQYVGKTSRCLMDRGRQHISTIEKIDFEGSTSGKMYRHFTSNNHGSRDMHIYAIEIVHGDLTTLSVREQFWMRTLDTVRSRLNTYKT